MRDDDLATTPIVFDLETAGLPDAAQFLEPVQPDKRLTDPRKIEADKREKEQMRFDRLALDWNVGRIVALGWWTAEHDLAVHVCKTEHQETASIVLFWNAARHRTLTGFNIKAFDLRYLVRRSQLLGIPYPSLDFSKYSRKGVTDLYLDLTFGDGHFDQGAMRRTLQMFCRRFGIPVTDTTSGKDIAALVAADDWAGVTAHCAADIRLTVQLAQRLGVVREATATAV